MDESVTIKLQGTVQGETDFVGQLAGPRYSFRQGLLSRHQQNTSAGHGTPGMGQRSAWKLAPVEGKNFKEAVIGSSVTGGRAATVTTDHDGN